MKWIRRIFSKLKLMRRLWEAERKIVSLNARVGRLDWEILEKDKILRKFNQAGPRNPPEDERDQMRLLT